MKRWLILVFGVVSYGLFLATFLYLAAFTGGFLVPTRLDGPLQSSMLRALTVNVLLVALFAVQHSVMARPGFKKWLTRRVPAAAERSAYVLATNMVLAFIFWQWCPMGGRSGMSKTQWHVQCSGDCLPVAG